jgi:hypothetical protein
MKYTCGVGVVSLLLAVSPMPSNGQVNNPGDMFVRLLEAANSGDPKAQLALARKYSAGEGVVQNDAAAAWWFTKAAQQGSAEAQFEVGGAYATGKGVPRDDAQAYQWFLKSAQQGLASAQFQVGAAFASGTGVGQDASQAFQWFQRAANQGDAEAQFWFGRAFQTGAAGVVDDGNRLSGGVRLPSRGSHQHNLSWPVGLWNAVVPIGAKWIMMYSKRRNGSSFVPHNVARSS